MAGKLVSTAKAIDDFIIDRVLQPFVNLADWHAGLPVHQLAKIFLVLGGGTGLIWVHRFDVFPSTDFYWDFLCLGIMVTVAYGQVRSHEVREPRRQTFMPAARMTGLLWRTAWLIDLALFPFQWPVEAHKEIALNFAWTALVVLPYWLICCRAAPPPKRRRFDVLAPVNLGAR